jgi:hypothetical protein
MNTTPRILSLALAASCLSLAACEDKSGTGGGGGGGGGLSGLQEDPKSTLGKSAAAGRDAGRRIESEQASAVGVAGELSGESTSLSIAGLTWPVPTTWQAQQASGMRAADYIVEGDARVLFFHFAPGKGGDITSNLERYRGMILDDNGEKADTRKRVETIAGSRVTIAEMEGTYQDDMGNPGGDKTPRAGWAMRVAMIEGPRGNIFIRFVGPQEVVEANQSGWNTLVKGMRPE